MTRPGPGKFEGNDSLEVSEYLYETVMSGLFDDEIGEAEFFGWHALITDIDKDDPLDKWPLTPDLKPAYIVVQDSFGFFTYKGFDLNTQARNVWRDITLEYARFWNGDDEVSIV